MDANQSIVDFNSKQIAENKSLINGSLNPKKRNLQVMLK